MNSEQKIGLPRVRWRKARRSKNRLNERAPASVRNAVIPALARTPPAADNRGMAIVGHGIDLVEVSRIARMHAEHGGHFLDRCFTAAEQEYCLSHKICARAPRPARFAAKQSVLKVQGTGWRGEIKWTDMEILNDSAGKPELTLSAETAQIAARLGITRWHLSITHTHDHAMASAIGESEST